MPADAVTAMLAQYFKVKGRHPDALLFCRMGASTSPSSRTLCRRPVRSISPSLSAGNISNETSRCREVPVRAHEPYFARLVRQSFRGICEQSKTPKEVHRRDAKGLLRRDVVQIVTTSLITEEGLLEPRLPARLATVARRRGHAAVAWPDLAEGPGRCLGDCRRDPDGSAGAG